MLPKWFDDWNAKNPTNIYGPAILVGVPGGAVFVAIALITLGQPFTTDVDADGPARYRDDGARNSSRR